MNRRRLLATSGAALSSPIVGCLEGLIVSDDGPEDAVTPTNEPLPEPVDPACGPADLPLTDLLTAETGDPEACGSPNGRAPSLAVENERRDSVTVTIEEENGSGFEDSYSLEPGERVVEQRGFEVAEEIIAAVMVNDDEEWTVRWPDRSCYRTGIALTRTGIDIGWIEPFRGSGDLQHDCYAGDDATIAIGSGYTDRTITLEVVNLCTGETFSETHSLTAGDSERISGAIKSGGMYTVSVSDDNGSTDSFAFHRKCWGLSVGYSGGEIQIREMGMG